MEHVDRQLLQTDLSYRIKFARDFIGFTAADGEALNAAAPLVGPLVKGVVDGVYSHLFKWDYTKSSFLPANPGFEGDRPATLEALTLDDPQIKYRKTFLTKWALKVFTADYDDPKTWEYLDKVGLMHTGVAGFAHRKNKEHLSVDLLACELLLGWVEDVLLSVLVPLSEDTLPAQTKLQVIRAVNKILWIQQDLFQRHYVRSDAEMAAAAVRVNSGGESYPVADPAINKAAPVESEKWVSSGTKTLLEACLCMVALSLVHKLTTW